MTKILTAPVLGGFIQSNMEIVEQSNISIYSVSNGAPVQSTATTITCNPSNSVFCDVNPSRPIGYNTVSRVIIKFVKQSGTTGGVFMAYAVNSDYSINANKPVGYLTEVTKDGVTYCIVDVTSRFFECNESAFKIAIVASSGQIVLSRDGTAGIEVQHIVDNDHIPNVGKLEKAVGPKGAYSLNTRNGKLLYTQQLYQSKGGKLPFALSMSFNPCDAESATPNSKSTGMKGWIFNYDQSLNFSGTDCSYLDGQHRYHTFKPSTNHTSIKYDCSARNGATLFNHGGGYRISDGKTTSLDFTGGRLVTITSKPGTSSMTTTISRDSEGKITSITDGMGDVYNFTYSTTSIVIKKADISLVEITLASGRVTSIYYPLDNRTVTFTYNDIGYLASAHDSLANEKVEWAYSQYNQVCTVRHYVTKDTNAITESYHLEYGFLQTLVNMCRNSANVNDSYSTMLYIYAVDGQMINNYEVQDELRSIRFNSRTDYTTSLGTAQGDVLVNVAKYQNEEVFFSVNALTASQSLQSDTFTINTSTAGSNLFMLSGQAQVIYSSCCLDPEDQRLELRVKSGSTVLCKIPFDVNKQHVQIQRGAFALPDGQHQLTVEFWANKLNVYARFDKMQIFAAKENFTKQCINVNTQTSSITEYVNGTAGSAWFDLTRFTLTYDAYTLLKVRYTVKDYVLTTLSRLQNPSSFNLWYNDGENMLSNITGASLTCGTGMYGIGSVMCANVSSSNGRTHFRYIKPSSSYLYQECNTTMVGQNGVQSVKQVNSKFQTVKVTDEKGIVTEYTYNSQGSVTKVKTKAPSGTLLNIEENTAYNTTYNLPSSTTDKRYYSSYIHYYGYGTDYELASETLPNSQVLNYTYETDKDKLSKISATVSSVEHSNEIEYTGDLVDTLTDSSTLVDFAYDERQNISQVNIAGTPVLSKVITYNASGTTQSVTTYGNGQKIKKYYDKYDRLIKASSVSGSSETVLVKYIYSDKEVASTVTEPTDSSLAISANSKLRVVIDSVANTRTVYTYDAFGNVSKTQNANITVTQTKDDYDRVVEVEQALSGSTVNNQYVYASAVDDTVVLESVEMGSNIISTAHTKDGLQRPTETKVMQGSYGHKTTLAYIPRQTREWIEEDDDPIIIPPILPTGVAPTALGGYWEVTDKGTTPYISTFKEYSMSGSTATLVRTDAVEYDANGNITKYGDVTYVYDKLNRLIRENNPALDKTFIWSYNALGNRTEVREYAYTEATSPTGGTTTVFMHQNGWGNQVTIISQGTTTKTISYDYAGNPTNYKGATLTWTRGRLLASYKPSGSSYTTTMQYDANGIRCSKTIPTSTQPNVFRYVYDGNNLVRETKSGTSSYTKTFLYNSQGIIGFAIGSTVYTYRKNLFGDIIAIYQGATKKAAYIYDAWGNCTITQDTDGIGTANPFRYRGYYWDNDLQLYYLMSRYYDPQTGRFINADTLNYLDPESINGLNLYAYCGNNPTRFSDPNGHIAISTLVWIIIIAAAVATAGTITYGAITDTPVVLDFSVSAGMGAGAGGKAGISIVLDFKNDSIGFYPHLGYYFGAKYNIVGGSYGVGIIQNYVNEGDYKGPFVNGGGGFYGGVDYCYDPRYPNDTTVKAYSLTFGNNKGFYYGHDEYWYWGSISFD